MNNETIEHVIWVVLVSLGLFLVFFFVFGVGNWVYRQTDFYKEEICNKYNGVIHVDQYFNIKCLVKNGND